MAKLEIKLVGRLDEAETLKNIKNDVLKTEKKIAAQEQALYKQEKFAANQRVKQTKDEINLNTKLSNSKKIAHSQEAQKLSELLATRKQLIISMQSELTNQGKITRNVLDYRKQIEVYNRSISEQQARVNALAQQSISIWDRLTDKAGEYFRYVVAAMALQQTTRVIKQMVNEVVELDGALVELRKVTDLEGESLDRFVDKAYNASGAVAKTGKEMIEAATAFAKSGYNPDDALQLGEIALMYTNIADEEIAAGDAADFIIAQMKAFNIEAKDSIHIIDAVNEVSNNFAVSSADIANNLGKASAVMANAGNSMEQYIAMMTAITEITRSADKAANGLKTLTLRLQGMNDEGEKDLEVQSKMEALFNKLGISVYKSNGELKNTYEIMESLAPVYATLTNAEKAYVTETIAGKHQAQNAAALLQNWTTAVKANKTAIDSQGSAIEENGKYIDSIKGRISALQSEFQKLSRNVISDDLIKNIISFGTTLLKIANNDAVQFIAKMTAMNAILILLSKTTIVKSISALLSLAATEGVAATATFALELATAMLNKTIIGRLIISFISYIAMLVKVTATQGVATAAMIGFKGALDLIAAHPIIFTFTAIISALYVMKKHTEALREEIENLQGELDDLSSISNRLGEISKELEDENITIEQQQTLFKEIKDIQQKLRKEYQLNTKELDIQTGSIQDQVKALKEYVELKEREKNIELLEKTTDLGAGLNFWEFAMSPSRWFDAFTKSGKQKIQDEANAYVESITTYAKNASKEIKESFADLEGAITDSDITADKLIEYFNNAVASINNSNLSNEAKGALYNQANNLYNDYLVALKDVFNRQKVIEALEGNFSGIVNKLITGADFDIGNGIKMHLSSALEAGLDSDWFRTQIKKISNEKGFADINIINELGLDSDENWDYLNDIIVMSNALGVPLENILNILISLYPQIASVKDMTAQTRTEFNLLNEQLDSIQDAYSVVTNALNEYNESGYFSIDTLEKILNLSDEYIDALMDENGNIRDNIDIFKELTEAKLDDIQASEDTRYYNELLRLSQLDEAGAAQLAAGSINLHDDAMAGQEVNAQKLRDEIQKNIEAFNEESAAALQAAYDIAEARHKQNTAAINRTKEGLTLNLNRTLGGSSSSSSKSSSKAWWEEELQKLKDQYNYNELTIEEYINALYKLRGQLTEGTDAWKKVNEELGKQRLNKIEDDYKANRISLEQYIESLKKLQSEYKKTSKTWLELAEKIKKGMQDLAKEQKSQMDTVKSGIDNVLDAEIDRLQEELDLLEKTNDETERAIELERLQEALENAKRNKTKRVWNGSEWVWTADQQAIDDAQKALDDFLLEDQKRVIQDQIDALQKLKQQYADATKEHDKMLAEQALKDWLGADAERQVLEDRISTWEKFRDEYLKIQKEIAAYDEATPESFSGVTSTNQTQTTTNTGGSTGTNSGGSTYIVKKGDTLSAIAKQYNTTWKKIYEANKSIIGSNPNLIKPGQKLTIPGYSDGGIVDYTGIAMVHGSKSKPEFIFNFDQMKKIISSISRPEIQHKNENKVQNISYNFSGDFNLPNVDNAQKFLRELKSQVNIKRHST